MWVRVFYAFKSRGETKGPPLRFFRQVLVNLGPFGGKYYLKKVSQCRKNERGDPFWFSSLGQQEQCKIM